MNIYIDESGSFVSTPKGDSWSVVVALAVAESEDVKLGKCLAILKAKNGSTPEAELKMNGVTEESYKEFLWELGELNLLLFSTAFDAGLGSDDVIRGQQRNQVAEIRSHVGKMLYPGGRQGVMQMAKQLEKVPPQLYAQLFCQVRLMYDVVAKAIPYFVQRTPDILSAFRWRVDGKDVSRTNYEDIFEKMTPMLLQTMSIKEPLMMFNGVDYSNLQRYRGPAPEYLRAVLGGEQKEALDIQKIVREDIQFADSKGSLGIQAADLVATGLRRCLRRQCGENEVVAALLGRLMVRVQYSALPLNLITFIEGKHRIAEKTAQLVRIMASSSKGIRLMRS